MDKGIKKFDRFIRNKVSDVEFSGEKDSWELLNYQLKEKAKSKRRNRILTYLFSLVLVASGVLFLAMPAKKENSAVESSKKRDIHAYTAPANTPENSEVKKNNLPGTYKEAPLRYKEKNISTDA